MSKHQDKKTQRVVVKQMQQIDDTNDKSKLVNAFKNCLNILRTEGITGERALRNMSYLVILKLLEPHFGGEINIDNHEYFPNVKKDSTVEMHKNKLLKFVRFSNMTKVEKKNIPSTMKYLWDDILSKHPATENIFLEGKGFDIKLHKTYEALIN